MDILSKDSKETFNTGCLQSLKGLWKERKNTFSNWKKVARALPGSEEWMHRSDAFILHTQVETSTTLCSHFKTGLLEGLFQEEICHRNTMSTHYNKVFVKWTTEKTEMSLMQYDHSWVGRAIIKKPKTNKTPSYDPAGKHNTCM